MFPDYIWFGSSAMVNTVSSGVLHGRPFGGVVTLLKILLCRTLQLLLVMIVVIVKVADWLLVNIYLPCAGANDRWTSSFDTLNEITSWCEQFNNLSLLFGGDFNCDLSSKSKCSVVINDLFKLAPVT